MRMKIPTAFASRKRNILAALTAPPAEYTDRSPKGSVDEGIHDLVNEINSLDGLVTTSSCAGRVSVFLEGPKSVENSGRNLDDKGGSPESDHNKSTSGQRTSLGGKGGGRWLYISHNPIHLDDASYGHYCNRNNNNGGGNYFHELFGLTRGDGRPVRPPGSNTIRLVHFRFEPMILHIMAATLHHARVILAAASTAGFRESGLQSLRCLASVNCAGDVGSPSPASFPIVAVRSSGLALESIIGYTYDYEPPSRPLGEPMTNLNSVVHSLVTEECLEMLIAIANERFIANKERASRFRTHLLTSFGNVNNLGHCSTDKTSSLHRQRQQQ